MMTDFQLVNKTVGLSCSLQNKASIKKQLIENMFTKINEQLWDKLEEEGEYISSHVDVLHQLVNNMQADYLELVKLQLETIQTIRPSWKQPDEDDLF